jgi:hypothetical protein
MNTTLTTRNIFKASSHAIGENTTNVAFNLPDRAFDILNDVAKPNRSALIRSWIADGIQKRNRFAGLAFRAAIGLRDFAKSIFTPNASPSEKAAVFQESASATEAPTNPAAKMIEDFTTVKPNGEYELSKD